MNYQITIDFAEGITPDTVALAKAVINNAILKELGALCNLFGSLVSVPTFCEPYEITHVNGEHFADIYASEITPID